MPTIHLTHPEAALILRLLEAERTTPQMLVHEAMNPKEDLQEWKEQIERLVDKFQVLSA